MWNIIKADMFRISRRKGIYVCIMFIVILLSVSIYLKSPGHIGMNGGSYNSEQVVQNSNASMEEIRDLSEGKSMQLDVGITSAGGNLYYFFLPVVFMVICSDLSNHTTKNVISTEVSRKTYYISKLILTLLICFSFILLHNYGGYVGSLLFNGSNSVSSLWDITVITLRQLPVYCGIISILVMLAFVCQKAALYNGISIALIMIIQIFIMLVSSIFKLDPTTLLQYEFEGIIRSVSVVTTLPMDTLLIALGFGIVLFIGALVIGWRYFKYCIIR